MVNGLRLDSLHEAGACRTCRGQAGCPFLRAFERAADLFNQVALMAPAVEMAVVRCERREARGPDPQGAQKELT